MSIGRTEAGLSRFLCPSGVVPGRQTSTVAAGSYWKLFRVYRSDGGGTSPVPVRLQQCQAGGGWPRLQGAVWGLRSCLGAPQTGPPPSRAVWPSVLALWPSWLHAVCRRGRVLRIPSAVKQKSSSVQNLMNRTGTGWCCGTGTAECRTGAGLILAVLGVDSEVR